MTPVHVLNSDSPKALTRMPLCVSPHAVQVMVTPGQPDVSVPITWSYNHHYGQYINGKDSVLVQEPATAHNDIGGHARPGDAVWVTRARPDDSNPTSTIPSATVFATGNGGEFRKSFHSYPAP